MNTAHLQEELSYEDAMKVLGYEPGAIVSPHLPAFGKVAEKLGELVRATKDEKLQTSFREELYRLNDALRVVEAERYREPPLRAKGMGLRLVLSLLLAGCVVAAGWYGNQQLIEGRQSRDKQSLEALAGNARLAVESRDWARAESIYSKLMELEFDPERAREGLRRISEG
ncbi:MAG: hypothetical protein CL922_07615, partial [Deltaproteobacteria bacterium]|nr:hypothetical protein [Deltaproteobacteria bacterium]